MSQSLRSAQEQSSGVRAYLLAGYYVASSNLSLMIAVLGVVLLILGWSVMTDLHQIFAGMFGVWGVSLVVLGLFFYGLFWANRIYARLT